MLPLVWPFSMLIAGRSVQVLCLTCKRVWSAKLTESYDDYKAFDKLNQLECPWCNRRNNVLRKGTTKKGITNGFAFP